MFEQGLYKRNKQSGKWVRVSDDVLGASPDDWDSEAAFYPEIIQINHRIYIFYNGNHYGKTGIGLAELFAN